MKKVDVPVRFTGTVSVLVPDSLNDDDARLLADKLAIAQMLATPENDDCGEALEAAFMEFFRESSLVVEQDASEIFDTADISDVCGTWTNHQHVAVEIPNNKAFYGLGLNPGPKSFYRGVIVIWDEDHDERILAWLDARPSHVLRELIAVGECKGSLELFWDTTVPDAYKEGEDTDSPSDGDCWTIMTSTPVRRYTRTP